MGDAIQQFLKKSPLRSGIQALQIREVWEQIMGKTIANYTDEIKIYNGKLLISTQVAPLKNELMYQREKIRERVNEVLGAGTITEVIISSNTKR